MQILGAHIAPPFLSVSEEPPDIFNYVWSWDIGNSVPDDGALRTGAIVELLGNTSNLVDFLAVQLDIPMGLLREPFNLFCDAEFRTVLPI